MNIIKSRTEDHFHQLSSIRSPTRDIDPQHNAGDVELLAQIGYKQELRRHYSTLQVFGIAFSIMGLLPSIASVLTTGLESGPAGLVWGWFLSSIFILCIGISLAFLGSAIPTSGGLYYYTNYYCPDAFRVPLSFMIGCSNSLGLIGGLCSISYGFAVQVLSAVYIQQDGGFEITNAKCYGIFVACVVSNALICCLATKQAAFLQTVSIIVNVFLVLLFLIAVPAGKGNDFNSRSFIFSNFENSRNYGTLWSFALSWMPAIWTIGAFDSTIHCSEEAKNAQRAIPVGIIGSISACWILGWAICIVCAACIKDGDVSRVLESDTGSAMAQIIYDALGKKWAVAFMSLIAVGQYLMSVSIMIALSRQIWSFARDDGLPVVYNFVKYVNPTIKVPVRATMFAAALGVLLGLLVLINGTAGSGALFSLAVASNVLSWGLPVLLILLPYGRKRFIPGPFYFGSTISTLINIVSVGWTGYVIVLCMFPDSMTVDKNSMNYTVVINVGVWLLALFYYFVWGYRFYTGPKSNLEEDFVEGVSTANVDEVLNEKV
ncbi:gaba-specific permease, putative [Candida dubliniensis CD36]|uniref:Gaba-specific permease, putative n=1 Tax=Candida dubliniensis (strain CD36 / ATCC MYA-646 / CBS 7987 / NCPF 3949 / NRRL Y-17841) TaxID=573826 RepID=B9WAW5_CANDC|nr:gaba-specific permease, putative [Candida dubliniensis CD36]CAX43535.1 gaba-specific permease, putative [Candida dubliniensis CD36]